MRALAFAILMIVGTFSGPSRADADVYQVLESEPGVSQQELRSAWRKLVNKHMPAVNRGDETAALRMKEINAAWNLVKTPEKRAQYDLSRGLSSGPSHTNTSEVYRESNIDELLAKHPVWAPYLKDRDTGMTKLMEPGTWNDLRKIYEEIDDENFVQQMYSRLSTLEDSPELRNLLKDFIKIDSKYTPEGIQIPHWRVFYRSALSDQIFSKEKFANLTVSLLPEYLRHAHNFAANALISNFFAKSFSLRAGDTDLWRLFKKQKRLGNINVSWTVAEKIFRGETADARDPELIVAAVKLAKDNSVMTDRTLAWYYHANWGTRGFQAIIESGDVDAMKGLWVQLQKPEFAGVHWNIFRQAYRVGDEKAAALLQSRNVHLKLNDGETPGEHFRRIMNDYLYDREQKSVDLWREAQAHGDKATMEFVREALGEIQLKEPHIADTDCENLLSTVAKLLQEIER